MSYVPNTDQDRARMLEAIGIESTEELFADIPEAARHPRLDLPKALSEAEVIAHLRELSERNADLVHCPSFLGAGSYRHYIPSVVGHLTGRSEFYTSYTPYQPEVSQGTLQYTYEYQSLICLLTGMDVANASMYDGATAVPEAASMAINVTDRTRIVLAPGLHPEYETVLHTYLQGVDVEVVPSERSASGVFSAEAARQIVDERTACLIVQNPNFFGCIEDLRALADVVHSVGALLVVAVNPISLGLLASPGECGADIVIGEGQPLGMATSFGGPYLGIFACRQQFIRQMPGRLVGATVDSKGQRGFVLTFQTREQHIRREKATSNICSNEALCALAATIYLTWLGPTGLRQVAEQCLQKAHYLARRIAELPGYELALPSPFFHEFAIRCPVPPETINRRLLGEGIIGGFPLGKADPGLADCLLLCCTELNTRAEMDRLVDALGRIADTTSVATASAGSTEVRS